MAFKSCMVESDRHRLKSQLLNLPCARLVTWSQLTAEISGLRYKLNRIHHRYSHIGNTQPVPELFSDVISEVWLLACRIFCEVRALLGGVSRPLWSSPIALCSWYLSAWVRCHLESTNTATSTQEGLWKCWLTLLGALPLMLFRTEKSLTCDQDSPSLGVWLSLWKEWWHRATTAPRPPMFTFLIAYPLIHWLSDFYLKKYHISLTFSPTVFLPDSPSFTLLKERDYVRTLHWFKITMPEFL